MEFLNAHPELDIKHVENVDGLHNILEMMGFNPSDRLTNEDIEEARMRGYAVPESVGFDEVQGIERLDALVNYMRLNSELE
jgi:hypothetical protein